MMAFVRRRSLTLAMFAVCLLAQFGHLDDALGHEAGPEGAVAICNWELFEQYGHDGFNWHWWGCNLSLMGQHQCRGGPNTNQCYTVTEAKREVRAFRAYTGRG